ncbi:MlaC/ttg2D family ABC transporter substrate-binding protein [Aquimonas voraii]|uniref:MlaC protein n=1 Tax=Aquimonas voraii TaxID=265719 RepID=A0A1G6WT12_9GAMM|nr:ABC transporter substrate-binding protein [Aquimonas voraii]SDD69028.1 MlaC protein [Aquimonas voraii]
MRITHLVQSSLLALLLCASVAVAANVRPAAIVEERTESVLKTLVEQRAEFSADRGKLDRFVETELDALFDREYSARLVLGRHSRGADPAKVSAFADALVKSLLKKYGAALLDADPSLDIKVAGETELRGGQIVRVASEIHRRGGAPVKVDYLFRPAGDAWLVFDVIVEGVSYVQTFRTQFDERLRRQSLDQVIEGLNRGEIDVEG